MVFFAQKTPDFGPKNWLRIWGVPPSPPFRIFFFSEKGVTDLGGTPPPFTDKIRKVVFDGLSNWSGRSAPVCRDRFARSRAKRLQNPNQWLVVGKNRLSCAQRTAVDSLRYDDIFSQEYENGTCTCWKWMSGFYCQGEPECREEKVTLIGEKPVEECQVFFGLHKTQFKIEVMSLCKGVSKILTAYRIFLIFFSFYHHKEEIRSFPTMYNT